MLAAATVLATHALPAQAALPRIEVRADAGGTRLLADGAPVFVKGINWDYFPVGTNYSYSLWTQSDAVIEAALDREMSLLRVMGVNVIRQYNGVPPRWVKYIYEQYGIWTVLNHALGRYGVTVGGVFTPQTDYSDPRVRAAITGEVLALVEEFRGTPGVLMWLLGNENNYGLTWRSAATENLPVGERDAAKARYLYSLVGEVARAIKSRDASRPVAFANGDLQYLDLIAQEAKGLDVFGTNVYRGISFGDLFERVKTTLGLPVMFTEFGADAWNQRDMREDQLSQARYLLGQWQEIYANTAGKGGAGNSIGGMTFQWTDGWWKYGQELRLNEHDTNASWSNAAYADDYSPGENNMNEEWWGIVAKGMPDARGLFPLYPRAAFYALQAVYRLDPYAPTTTAGSIRSHFAAIAPAEAELRARADRAAAGGDIASRFSVSGLRFDLQTFNTGGTRISTPSVRTPSETQRPSFLGFDRMESFYADVTARPAESSRRRCRSTCWAMCRTTPSTRSSTRIARARARCSPMPRRCGSTASSGWPCTRRTCHGTTAISGSMRSTGRATAIGGTKATSSASTVRPITAGTWTSTTAMRRPAWSSPANACCRGSSSPSALSCGGAPTPRPLPSTAATSVAWR
jgi:hypothetical protein